MNCPNCGTQNDPVNQFCISCGQTLNAETSRYAGSARTRNELLGIPTVRLLIALFGLWLLRLIINGLSFVQELRIPDFDLPITTIINSLIFLLMAALLVSYARFLATYWPLRFPRFREAVSPLAALIYLGVLAVIYKAVRPFFPLITFDSEPLMVFQIVLLVIAIWIVGWSAFIVYNALPAWITQFRQAWAVVPVQQVEKDKD